MGRSRLTWRYDGVEAALPLGTFLSAACGVKEEDDALRCGGEAGAIDVVRRGSERFDFCSCGGEHFFGFGVGVALEAGFAEERAGFYEGPALDAVGGAQLEALAGADFGVGVCFREELKVGECCEAVGEGGGGSALGGEHLFFFGLRLFLSARAEAVEFGALFVRFGAEALGFLGCCGGLEGGGVAFGFGFVAGIGGALGFGGRFAP